MSNFLPPGPPIPPEEQDPTNPVSPGPMSPGGQAGQQFFPPPTPLEQVMRGRGNFVPLGDQDRALRQMALLAQQESARRSVSQLGMEGAQRAQVDLQNEAAMQKQQQQQMEQVQLLNSGMMLNPQRLSDPEAYSETMNQIDEMGPNIDPELYQSLKQRATGLRDNQDVVRQLRSALNMAAVESYQQQGSEGGLGALARGFVEGSTRGEARTSKDRLADSFRGTIEDLERVFYGDGPRKGNLGSTGTSDQLGEQKPAANDPWLATIPEGADMNPAAKRRSGVPQEDAYRDQQEERMRRRAGADQLTRPQGMSREAFRELASNIAVAELSKMEGIPEVDTASRIGDYLGFLAPVSAGMKVAGKVTNKIANKLVRGAAQTGVMGGLGATMGLSMPLADELKLQLDAMPEGKREDAEAAYQTLQGAQMALMLPLFTLTGGLGDKIGRATAGLIPKGAPGAVRLMREPVRGLVGGAVQGGSFMAAMEAAGYGTEVLTPMLEKLGMDEGKVEEMVNIQALTMPGPIRETYQALDAYFSADTPQERDAAAEAAWGAVERYADESKIPFFITAATSMFGRMGVQHSRLRWGRSVVEKAEQEIRQADVSDGQKEALEAAVREAQEAMGPAPEDEARMAAREELVEAAGGPEEAAVALTKQQDMGLFPREVRGEDATETRRNLESAITKMEDDGAPLQEVMRMRDMESAARYLEDGTPEGQRWARALLKRAEGRQERVDEIDLPREARQEMVREIQRETDPGLVRDAAASYRKVGDARMTRAELEKMSQDPAELAKQSEAVRFAAWEQRPGEKVEIEIPEGTEFLADYGGDMPRGTGKRTVTLDEAQDLIGKLEREVGGSIGESSLQELSSLARYSNELRRAVTELSGEEVPMLVTGAMEADIRPAPVSRAPKFTEAQQRLLADVPEKMTADDAAVMRERLQQVAREGSARERVSANAALKKLDKDFPGDADRGGPNWTEDQIASVRALESVRGDLPAKEPEGLPPAPDLEVVQPLDSGVAATTQNAARFIGGKKAYYDEIAAKEGEDIAAMVAYDELVAWWNNTDPESVMDSGLDLEKDIKQLRDQVRELADVKTHELPERFLKFRFENEWELTGPMSIPTRMHPEGRAMFSDLAKLEKRVKEARSQAGHVEMPTADQLFAPIRRLIFGGHDSFNESQMARMAKWGETVDFDPQIRPVAADFIKTTIGSAGRAGREMTMAVEKISQQKLRYSQGINSIAKVVPEGSPEAKLVSKLIGSWGNHALEQKAWDEASPRLISVARIIRRTLLNPMRKAIQERNTLGIELRQMAKDRGRAADKAFERAEGLQRESDLGRELLQREKPGLLARREQLDKKRKQAKRSATRLKSKAKKAEEGGGNSEVFYALYEEAKTQARAATKEVVQSQKELVDFFEKRAIPFGEGKTLRDPFTAAKKSSGAAGVGKKLRTEAMELSGERQKLADSWDVESTGEFGAGANFLPRIPRHEIARRSIDVPFEKGVNKDFSSGDEIQRAKSEKRMKKISHALRRKQRKEGEDAPEWEEDIIRIMFHYGQRSIPQILRNEFLANNHEMIHGRVRSLNAGEAKQPGNRILHGTEPVTTHGEYVVVDKKLIRESELPPEVQEQLAKTEAMREIHRAAGVQQEDIALPRKVIVVHTDHENGYVPKDGEAAYKMAMDGNKGLRMIPAWKASDELFTQHGGFKQVFSPKRMAQMDERLQRFVGTTDEAAGILEMGVVGRVGRFFGSTISSLKLGTFSPGAAVNSFIGAASVQNASVLGVTDSMNAVSKASGLARRIRKARVRKPGAYLAKVKAGDLGSGELFFDRDAESRLRTPEAELAKMSPAARARTELADDMAVDYWRSPISIGSDSFYGFDHIPRVRAGDGKRVTPSKKKKAVDAANPTKGGWIIFDTAEKAARAHLFVGAYHRARKAGRSREESTRIAENMVIAAHGVLNKMAKSPLMAHTAGAVFGPVTNWMQHSAGVNVRLARHSPGQLGRLFSQGLVMQQLGYALGLDWGNQVGMKLSDIPFVGEGLDAWSQGIGVSTEQDPEGQERKPITQGIDNAIEDIFGFKPFEQLRGIVADEDSPIPKPIQGFFRIMTGDLRAAATGLVTPVHPAGISGPVLSMVRDGLAWASENVQGNEVRAERAKTRFLRGFMPRIVSDIEKFAKLEKDPDQPDTMMYRSPTTGYLEYRVNGTPAEAFVTSLMGGQPLERAEAYYQSRLGNMVEKRKRNAATSVGERGTQLMWEYTQARTPQEKQLVQTKWQEFKTENEDTYPVTPQKLGQWKRYMVLRNQMDRRQRDVVMAYDKSSSATNLAYQLTNPSNPLTQHEYMQIRDVLGGSQGFRSWVDGLSPEDYQALGAALKKARARWSGSLQSAK